MDKVRIYISKHGKAPTDQMEHIVKECEALGVEPHFHVVGATYDSYKVKNAHIVITIPWYDEDLFKLGKGTEVEHGIAVTYEGRTIFWNRVANRLQNITKTTKMHGEGYHFTAFIQPGGDNVDLADLIKEAESSDRPWYEIDEESQVI